VLGFDGRVAVVTGAGGGLGRAHALELARRGAAVVVNDIGASLSGESGNGDTDRKSPAQHVVDEIVAAGGTAIANQDSIATPEGGKALVDAAVGAFGRLDIVVNNAGILRDKSFHNTMPEQLDPVLAVHLVGAFNVTRPAWVQMREQNYGRVIVTSSSAGLFGNFGQSAYGSAKMGLVGLIKVLAIEGAKYNIKANAIAPMARTRMTEGLNGDLDSLIGPEKVAPVVAYLAHESCALTGETLSCAAGRVARIFVGLTNGYLTDDLTAESVAENLDTILDPTGYTVPNNSTFEVHLLLDMIAQHSGQQAGAAGA
jgi:NAD(P)-dependent dehydrogenase (short-subunit alcohol dehydrogenase family)